MFIGITNVLRLSKCDYKSPRVTILVSNCSVGAVKQINNFTRCFEFGDWVAFLMEAENRSKVESRIRCASSGPENRRFANIFGNLQIFRR